MAIHTEKFYLADPTDSFLELITTFYDAQGTYNLEHPLNNNFTNFQGGGQVVGPKSQSWNMVGMIKINVKNEIGEIEEMWTPMFEYLEPT